MRMSRNHKIGHLLITLFVLFGLMLPPSQTVTAQEISTLAAATIIRFPGDVSTLHDAFAQVPDGGIIEIASGTYIAPAPDGWNIGNLNKRFTVRAAAGANVVLSGYNDRVIIRYQNSPPLSSTKFVTFENIHFSSGYSNREGLAGGITMYSAKAIFKNCIFSSNRSNTTTTSGAAAFVVDSRAFFFNTTFTANNSRVGGAAIGIRNESQVYVHASQFTNNNNSDLYDSVGGAINLGNSLLRVTNSRFDNNRAGLYGGALYIIGNWKEPRTTPTADVIVANSVFSNNSAMQDATTGFPNSPTEGGAINIEDQSRVKVYNSRFINNRANIAGAVNNYRSQLEVHGSVFLGNQAIDQRDSSGFGGAISLNSSDVPDDGADNKPNASLVMRNSWLQGRYGSTTTSAITGACLSAGGDSPRIENDGVPNVGTLADNRAQVNIADTAFYDCDTYSLGDRNTYKPSSAAVYVALTNMVFQNSVIANSDATVNSNGLGGGISITYHTVTNLTGSTIAGNTASIFGGGVFVQGAQANISGSKIFENSTPTYGGAIFSTIDEGRNINASGSINNNTFSHNLGSYSIYDDDRDLPSVPYNDVQYNGNQFYNGVSGGVLYRDSITGNGGASYLNQLNVIRDDRGVNTDKSPQNNNTEVSSAPVVATILAAPNYILTNRAAGEAANPTSRVLYAWSGGSASFNGKSVSGVAGASEEGASGTKTLSVGGKSFTTSIGTRPNPAATFTISGNAPNYTLNWALQSGAFLDAVIDQDVNISPTASGSVNVTESGTVTYDLYIVTEEGGYLASVNNASPVLSAPDSVNVLVGLYPARKSGSISLQNAGASTINWSASSPTAWISISPTSGSFTQNGSINFVANLNSTGKYQGQIVIQSNGGNKTITVNAVVVNQVRQLFLPTMAK